MHKNSDFNVVETVSMTLIYGMISAFMSAGFLSHFGGQLEIADGLPDLKKSKRGRVLFKCDKVAKIIKRNVSPYG
jgi:hypothetical protein